MKEAQKLLQMLSYKRPAGSKAELTFCKRYIQPLGAKAVSGNFIIEVPGDKDTLFSCHTDTVHQNGGTQTVLFDSNLAIAYKDDNECLGADDTAGVWLLIEMIKAKIPGTYIFHYGEEKGCIGSKALAREHPELLRQYKRAIAFDRRGTTSIITHQVSQRCCSDIFGKALGDMLGRGYKNDSTGLYTDTASYTGLIPECTNISVGYEHQHCSSETQDVGHLLLLRELVMKVEWSKLPTDRDPNAKPRYIGHSTGYYGSGYDWERNKLSTLIEEELTEENIYKLAKKATLEVDEMLDAVRLCNKEPALAGRMLYAFVSLFFAATVRRDREEKAKHQGAQGASPPGQKKLSLVATQKSDEELPVT